MYVYLVVSPGAWGQEYNEFYGNITIEQTLEQAEAWCVKDAMSECEIDGIHLIEKDITVEFNEPDTTIYLKGKYIDPEEGEKILEIEYGCKKYSMPKPSKFEQNYKWTSLSDYNLHS